MFLRESDIWTNPRWHHIDFTDHVLYPLGLLLDQNDLMGLADVRAEDFQEIYAAGDPGRQIEALDAGFELSIMTAGYEFAGRVVKFEVHDDRLLHFERHLARTTER